MNSAADSAIVENNQTQIYLVDANTVTNLKAGSQYALVPIKEEKPQIKCFVSHQDGANSAQKKRQVWNATCSPAQKQPCLTFVKAEEVTSSSADNDSIKIVQVDSQHLGKENSTSLITLSSAGNRVIDNNEKATVVSAQHYSEDSKSVTFATLSPLCQIQQYGQQYSQHPSSEICCPISSTPHQVHPITSECTTQDSKPNSCSSSHSRSTLSGWRAPSVWSPYHNVESCHHGHNVTTPTVTHATPTGNVSLNSSGEEVESISPEYPRVPHNTPTSCEATRMSIATLNQMPQMVGPLDNVPYYLPFNGRENHNEKERKRRNRIKNACQSLRTLVPGLSDKTDKATVFEFTVQYLMHLKRHVGSNHDKEFMQKYSPY